MTYVASIWEKKVANKKYLRCGRYVVMPVTNKKLNSETTHESTQAQTSI